MDCRFIFKSHPGKDYKYLLDNLQEFGIIKTIDLDVIIVILGSNSICDEHTNIEINNLASEFYTKLKQVVRPDCLRLTVQIEPRFVEAGNRFGTPEAEEFNTRRTIINNFVNKKLKKYGLVDIAWLCKLLGSVNILRNPKYFLDGVHLKCEGLLKYKEAVIHGLEYALESQHV